MPVLSGIDLDLATGGGWRWSVASGSGKSTLLHLLGGLDDASGGSVAVMGREMMGLSQSRPWRLAQPPYRIRLSVPPPPRRILGARECRHAAADPSRAAR